MKLSYKIAISALVLAVFVSVYGLITPNQPVVAKDKGVLKEVVKIHYKLPFDKNYKKPPFPGKPVVACQETTNDNVNYWGEIGWQMPNEGLTYQINYKTVPGNISDADFQQAITNSVNTWKQAATSLEWIDGGSTDVKKSRYDGVNLIAFGSASGAIAVARTWYWTGTGEIAESDIIFSKNLDWSITDPNAGDCAGVDRTYDVQNIATHEFGHQVGLNDLYDKAYQDLTMYGYGTMAELKKDSLGTGDINGAISVAP